MEKTIVSFVLFDCLSVRPPSVRMKKLGSHLTDFREIWYLSIFRKSIEKIQVHYNLTKIMDTLHEAQYTFVIISL